MGTQHRHSRRNNYEQVQCCLCDNNKTALVMKTQGFRIVRCSACNIVYVNPRYTAQKLQDLYDTDYFMGIGKRYFDGEWRSRYFKPVIDQLISVTGIHSGTVLDVGAAAGHLIKSLQDRNFSVSGVELSRTASEFARKNLNVPVKTGDILSVKYPKDYFDIITMNDVIEHTRNPKKELGCIRRYLKPKGWLMLSTPNIDSLGYRVFKEGFVFIAPSVHLWYFTPQTLTRLLRETGFTVRKITFPFFETPFFNLGELVRLGVNLTRKLLLTPHKTIPSAPWYGNVMKIYAQKI